MKLKRFNVKQLFKCKVSRMFHNKHFLTFATLAVSCLVLYNDSTKFPRPQMYCLQCLLPVSRSPSESSLILKWLNGNWPRIRNSFKCFQLSLISVYILQFKVLLLPKPSETNNFFIHRLFLILYLISFFLERKVKVLRSLSAASTHSFHFSLARYVRSSSSPRFSFSVSRELETVYSGVTAAKLLRPADPNKLN